jgi:hypothetical protein
MSGGGRKMLVLIGGIMLSSGLSAWCWMMSSAQVNHVSWLMRGLWGLGILATFLWMLGFFVWTIAVDSKARWPHLRGFFNRAGAVFMLDARYEDARA